MQLHQLDIDKKKAKKRIGRGGKRGTFSGKGIKGQKSRAGRKIRPSTRDSVQSLPKLRGSKDRDAKKNKRGAMKKQERSNFKETNAGKTN